MKTHYRIEKMPDASACRITAVDCEGLQIQPVETLVAEGLAWSMVACTNYAAESGFTHRTTDAHGVLRCFREAVSA